MQLKRWMGLAAALVAEAMALSSAQAATMDQSFDA